MILKILTWRNILLTQVDYEKKSVSHIHHYKVNCLYVILDLQFQEFNHGFNEVNTNAYLRFFSFSYSFSKFDYLKLMKLSKFHPNDFIYRDCKSLEQESDNYIKNVRNDEIFTYLKSLGELAHMLVKNRKHMSYSLVYSFLKLVLILHVGIAIVGRCFLGNEDCEDSSTQLDWRSIFEWLHSLFCRERCRDY